MNIRYVRSRDLHHQTAICHEQGCEGIYLAIEVDLELSQMASAVECKTARIAELEHQLSLYKDSEFMKVCGRVVDLEKALRNLATVPAVVQVLGSNHTAGCPCPLCVARKLVL